ncbi:MAG: 2Fe-2S iron-sulfur cluster binding domain-containing protein [Nocardioidaceae bacterium]|nr:2Fe-2S iron-sulfur cluster binding domain-containing protein [Nocardioidaceae bacterium]
MTGAGPEGARTVKLRFEDDHAVEFPVEPGQTVLEAAEAAEVFLASQCRVGSCGTCLASLLSGSTRTVAGRTLSLLPSEQEAGARLLCSTEVDGDATFELGYDSGLASQRPALLRAVVTGVQQVSGTVVELRLELADEIPPVVHAAGQYARLRVPGTDQWRSYSMAGTARALPELVFCVKLIPGGAMSAYLERAVPGDELEVEYPLGGFSLRGGTGQHVFVAGGTGLAPVLAMVDELRERRGPKPPVLVCFACQSGEDLFGAAELRMRAFWMPGLTLRIGVTEGDPPDEETTRGTPVSLLGEEPLAPDAEAYVCGPPGMVAAAADRLTALGMAAHRVHAEKFVPTDT